jgi:apolipoprotein N-acyltransferase
MPCLVAVQPSRLAASAASFAYYSAASVPLIAVTRLYWPSLGLGAIAPWLIAAAIVSSPFMVCWTHKESRRPWITAVAVGLSAIPPLCIVGWASLLISAGVLFPAAAWLGLIAILALPSLLLCTRTRGPALLCATAASIVLNLQTRPIGPPRGWEAVATSIHRARIVDTLTEFTIEERLQAIALSSDKKFLIFPEGAVRRWTDATEAFWTAAIAGSGKTLLIGAVEPLAGSRLYNNSIVIIGEHPRAAVHQRIPVPGGMWNPLRSERSFALNLLGAGTVDLSGQRAATLICYEQLLLWPMLRSAVERPTLLIAVSNEAWTASTRIPIIQHACVRAWARLFGLPVISAINS